LPPTTVSTERIFFQVLVRHGEVVAVKDHEIGELAGLDRAELVLLAQEPAVLARNRGSAPPGA